MSTVRERIATLNFAYIYLYRALNKKSSIYKNYFVKHIDKEFLSLVDLMSIFADNDIVYKYYINMKNMKYVCYELDKYYESIRNMETRIKKYEKQIQMFKIITKNLMQFIVRLTGCNVYIKNINISDTCINEIFYSINSMYQVLHVMKINETSYLLELNTDKDAYYLAKQYGECYFDVYDEENSDENNTIEKKNSMKIEFIDSLIINKIVLKNDSNDSIPFYRNIYNNKLYPLEILQQHCMNQRKMYEDCNSKYITM